MSRPAEGFGLLLRYHRRQCRDPLRGGPLTQARLGELLGDYLGDAGYSGAAVSDWERDKSKISEDDRLVLVSLIRTLYQCGGLSTIDQADALLQAGNYRDLDRSEAQAIFGDAAAAQKSQPTPAETPFQAPGPGRDPRQHILLDKVKGFWISGYMAQSVSQATLIDLDRRPYPQAVAHPWEGVLGADALEEPEGPDERTLLDIYYDADRALLILGQPGVGKTTTLLQLADELIERAENDARAPVPVVLHLASWAERRGDLGDWVVEELTAKYQIPRRLGLRWLADDTLLLLLDGFDEVPHRYRGACALAINRFRETNGLTGLVVCSRLEAYERLGQRLHLGGATLLQPLSADQVDRYLAAAGQAAGPLRAAVDDSPELAELATSPLALSVIVVAYGDAPEADAAAPAEPDGQDLGPLFNGYIQRMFARRQADPHFPVEPTVGWLSWLAHQMVDHSQSLFLVEQLQPSWLPTRRQRWFYMLMTGFLAGAVGGLVMWLLLQLLRQSTPQLPAPLSEQTSSVLNIAQGRAEFITLLLTNIGLGLVVVAIQTAFYDQYELARGSHVPTRRRRRWRTAATGLAVLALTFLAVGFFAGPILALAWAIAEAVMFMTIAYSVYGHSYRNEIRVVEALGWSWASALSGLIIGLLLAAVAEILDTLLYGSDGISRTVIVLGVGGFLLGGLRGRRVHTRNRPNEAIFMSLRNALTAALLVSLILGAIAWPIHGPRYAFQLAILVSVIALALFGGANVIKHFLLRLVLSRRHYLPWPLIRFLNHSANLVFLRRVGGGYMFIHRQMQDYFANLPLYPQADADRSEA